MAADDLIQAVRQGQLEMNMLLSAVHHLLMGERDHPLADWYPSLGGNRTDGNLMGEFTKFVDERRDAVAELIGTRLGSNQ